MHIDTVSHASGAHYEAHLLLTHKRQSSHMVLNRSTATYRHSAPTGPVSPQWSESQTLGVDNGRPGVVRLFTLSGRPGVVDNDDADAGQNEPKLCAVRDHVNAANT